MSIIQKIESWSSSHNPRWLAFFRVALGLSLLMRGVSFLNHSEDFHKLIASSSLSLDQPWVANVVPWIHIVGGFLIVVGLATRAACLIQIPVVLVALLFISVHKGFFAVETDLSLSVFILLLLVVFFIEGSGPVSLANYFKDPDEENEEEEEGVVAE